MRLFNRVMVMSIAMFACLANNISGQEVNREKLLNLFYKANTEREAEDIKAAISTYTEILELSPDLPEPHMHLGDLYSTLVDSLSKVKAINHYSRYLELSPDAENAEDIKAKISSLNTLSTDKVSSIPATVSESLPVMIDTARSGRWASAEMSDGKREIWIIDIDRRNSPSEIILQDSSSILTTDKKLSEAARNAIINQTEAGSIGFRFTVDIDTLPRYAQEPQTILAYTYEFRMKYDGSTYRGELHRLLTERGHEEIILKDDVSHCCFHPVPDDYQGFTHVPVTEEMLAGKAEFRELFSSKAGSPDSSALALNDLGCLYLMGIGIPKNMKIAMAYLKRASDKGNMFAKLNMAELYRSGDGTEKNFKKAIDLYNAAFDSGFSDAMVLCGDTYLDSIPDKELSYKQALDCYQKAALKRSPHAYQRLGMMYKEGLGVEKDLSMAWNYYQKAVAMQHPDAMAEASFFYRKGIIVKQDPAKALDLLLKAAETGSSKAMYELSDMYLKGDGTEQNFMTSKEWLRKAMKADELKINGYNTIRSKIMAIINEEN